MDMLYTMTIKNTKMRKMGIASEVSVFFRMYLWIYGSMYVFIYGSMDLCTYLFMNLWIYVCFIEKGNFGYGILYSFMYVFLVFFIVLCSTWDMVVVKEQQIAFV